MNLCRSCNQDFGSVSLFDRHRVGAYEPGNYKGHIEDWSPELGRRCLDEEEMTERGWELDARGRWTDPVQVERARRNFAPALNSPTERPRKAPGRGSTRLTPVGRKFRPVLAFPVEARHRDRPPAFCAHHVAGILSADNIKAPHRVNGRGTA
jgi:hypothetical protein